MHGTGRNTRDWGYVADLCRGIDGAMQVSLDKIRGEVINLGSGSETDINEIARLVLEKTGAPSDLITYLPDRRGQVMRNIAATEKAAELLGWKPEIAFEEGITVTIDWYCRHPEWWQRLTEASCLPVAGASGEIADY